MGFQKIILKAFNKGSLAIAERTPAGRRILTGIQEGRNSAMLKFKGLEANHTETLKAFQDTIVRKAPSSIARGINDKEFQSVLSRFAQKQGLQNINWANLSEEEIMEIFLQKSGVGPCKFAQIISSDESIMSKLSPKLQTIIKRTQSENPFSRTVDEAQEIVNKAFTLDSKHLITANGRTGTFLPPAVGGGANSVQIVKPLSAGTVGEAYLAKTSDGEEVIIKMIKKNVDKEQLELEQVIMNRFLDEFSPNELTRNKTKQMLQNLYKDWGKELDFRLEYANNKALGGGDRYKVADIKQISPDGSCILMEKAQGIQMNNLMQMLKDYKSNPSTFAEKYAKEIKENPWLADPKKVITELPTTITKAFDEMFMFSKKGGTSMMHGDPHMGNYFITAGENGKLIPMFIDTGNCIKRTPTQIQEDLKFLTNYFVGNSKGLAKYFVKQCNYDSSFLPAVTTSQKMLTAGAQNTEAKLIEKVGKEIQENVFNKRHNITDVDAVQKTIRVILENNGLTMRPEASTALKAQMQFFTGITETAALSGKTVDVGTIVKDVPEALWCMVKAKSNPISTIKEALGYAYKHQTQSTSSIYQFLAPQQQMVEIMTAAPSYNGALQTAAQTSKMQVFA